MVEPWTLLGELVFHGRHRPTWCGNSAAKQKMQDLLGQWSFVGDLGLKQQTQAKDVIARTMFIFGGKVYLGNVKPV